MTQLFRVCKPQVCSIVRNYSFQRSQSNHYKTLKVSSDASQEDIKRAFLKLSKQLHPDISGRHSHTDFVRLNEAYSILGKACTRRKYDEELQNLKMREKYMYNYSQGRQYGSRWEYEVRTAGGQWPPPPQSNQNQNISFGLTIALLFFGLGLFQLIFIMHSMKVRQLNKLQSVQIERQYKHMQEVACNRSNSKHPPDATDLTEFLTEDDRRY